MEIKLKEEDLTSAISKWLYEVDSDDLARVCGEIFGGKCFHKGDDYIFIPNENYFGGFGEI